MHIDINSLRQRLSYNPDTGVFRWVIPPTTVIKPNAIAGTRTANGYRQIRYDNHIYYAHRLAWLYTYGNFPDRFIDHINRVRDDNRIANLREADDKQNCQNMSLRSDNDTGVRGVSWNASRGKWRAKIRDRHLGMFSTISEARAAYQTAADEMFTHHRGVVT